jgi:predicted enzyme related to lactoylglutathione lyase
MSVLATPDSEAANAFYHHVFGWETDSFGPMTLFRLPGFVGGEPEQPVPRDLVAVGQPGETPRWDVGFWVDDVDATAERAESLGGAVLQPPQDAPVGRTAVLADPQGAPFSVSRVTPA